MSKKHLSNHDTVEKKWWLITASWDRIDEDADLLFALGMSGLELKAGEFCCYIELAEGDIAAIRDSLNELGVEIKSIEALADENWLKNCRELWKPVAFEKVSIMPILDEGVETAIKEGGQILIIPGEGFGTGHHATTRMIIEILQGMTFSPRQALDVGCGSGILAFVINELFTTRVDAIDNDERALLNAEKNCALNGMTDHISFSSANLSSLDSKYDLITANIYGEVLIEMRLDFERLIHPDGRLIISGINNESIEKVRAAFFKSWTPLEQRESSGWHALDLKKL